MYIKRVIPGLIISPFVDFTTISLSSKCLITSSKLVNASSKLISAPYTKSAPLRKNFLCFSTTISTTTSPASMPGASSDSPVNV